MKRNIKINNKKYSIEFGIKALFCVELIDLLTKGLNDKELIAELSNKAKNDKKVSDKDLKIMTQYIKNYIPQFSLNLFVAGMLEHNQLQRFEIEELYNKYLEENNYVPSDIIQQFTQYMVEDNYIERLNNFAKALKNTESK